MQLCNGLLRQHHHIQQVKKGTLRTLRRNIHQTKSSRTQTQTRKMLFLQKAHTVSWTLNLSRRNSTLPEKLKSIAKMPAPKNPKEVKQFLGLVGYYRKFVPRSADISRALTHLTKKDVEFK